VLVDTKFRCSSRLAQQMYPLLEVYEPTEENVWFWREIFGNEACQFPPGRREN
jgi:hypothetical protein